jgi:putative N-acetylmannosamine-6-phosphate epimerase
MAKTTEEMLDDFVEARIEGYLIAKHEEVEPDFDLLRETGMTKEAE